MFTRGVVYKVYKMGPRTLPCGTPKERGVGSDVTLSILTHCDLPDK